jgi:hypothetical protein
MRRRNSLPERPRYSGRVQRAGGSRRHHYHPPPPPPPPPPPDPPPPDKPEEDDCGAGKALVNALCDDETAAAIERPKSFPDQPVPACQAGR